MTNHPPTIHPLVASYLEELTRLLVDLDPVERAEVVQGVGEHLDSALAATAHTETDVRAALAEVGPAPAVAEEAYAGRPPAPRPPARVPATSRSWLPVVAAGFQAGAVFVALATAATFSTVTTSTTGSGSATGGATTVVTESQFDGSLGSGVVAFYGALPLWLVVVVLVGLSALWVGREKLALIAVMPVCVLAVAVLPEIGYRLLGVNGVYAGAWVASALPLLGGGVLVWILTRRATHRATALTSI
ncbi:MAG: hypothetical protein ABI083_04715 [Lapillicoccus sp.]